MRKPQGVAGRRRQGAEARKRVRASTVDLDDPASYRHLDPAGMLRFAVDFPEQVREAVLIGRRFAPPDSFQAAKLVVLSGMGGSAVVGDFLAGLLEKVTATPFLVTRSYSIPKWVGPDTLFIASSHSGDTEETLVAAQAARRRGASILCVTTGGKLREFAQHHLGPKMALLEIPQTDPPMPPRAALGYSFIPLVCLMQKLRLYPGGARHLSEALSVLERLRRQVRPDVPLTRNRAKRLARDLYGRIPWIHGTVGIMSAAAYRWRTQLNENSKALAYSHEYPELNHNEVIGWERARWIGPLLQVVTLVSPSDHWRVRARVEITREKIIESGASLPLIQAEGRSPLAQLLWTVYLGDFVSLYLAFLNGVDPAAIGSIQMLKRELARAHAPRPVSSR